MTWTKLKLLAGDFKGKTVAVIMCDSGLKYLSAVYGNQ